MSDQMLERPLPSAKDAERALLGSIIQNNRLRDEAAASLTPEDFYVPSHRAIFSAMLALEGTEINSVTIANALKFEGRLEDAGGLAYLGELTFGIPFVGRLKSYIELIKDKALKRRMAQYGYSLASRAMEDDCEAGEVLGWGEEVISDLRAKAGVQAGGFRTFAEIAKDAADHYERLRRGESKAIATGFDLLDRATRGGIQPGEMWVVAALTGRGKSAWAINAARQMGRRGVPVGIVSREMADLDNFIRAHSPVAGVPAWHISAGLRPWDYERLMETLDDMAGLPIHVDSRTSNLFEIRAKVKQLKKQGIQALFVDYLQLLNYKADSPHSTRAQEVAACSRMLKEIAMDLEIGVFALAQFNRLGAHEERPEIHHLKESGSIEMDADLILILDMDDVKEGSSLRRCNMRIAKQRNGPQLTLRYEYNGDVLTFSEAA